MSDEGMMLDRYPSYWVAPASKGYQGIQVVLRSVVRRKTGQWVCKNLIMHLK